MPSIDLASSNNASVLALLRAHPAVAAVAEGTLLLEFHQGELTREVRMGDPSAEVFGLVELVDNNPLVCASNASIPRPAGTLASIALGPLLLAGVALRPPLLHLNFPGDASDVVATLRALAPIEQLRLLTPTEDPSMKAFVEGGIFGKGTSAQGVLAAQASVEVPTSLGLSDIVSMFEERFGRSFYIRRETSVGFFRTEALAARPFASYRVGTSKASSATTVFVEVAAAPDGKPGAAGLVHAMNVMAGLEESLGLSN